MDIYDQSYHLEIKHIIYEYMEMVNEEVVDSVPPEEVESDEDSLTEEDPCDTSTDSGSDAEQDEYFSDDNIIYKISHLGNNCQFRDYSSDHETYDDNGEPGTKIR